MAIGLRVDGREVVVEGDDASLLEALRDELGLRSPKDGCSPQGQCGCCTVLVDGVARVSCVTAVRRVAGRSVVTADGLDAATATRLVDSFVATGASQCGFCTPGILCRLAAPRTGPRRRTGRDGPARPPLPLHRVALGDRGRCRGGRRPRRRSTSDGP